MTSTVTAVTIRAILSNNFDGLSTSFGLIAILFLLVLLVLKELVRALETPRAKAWMQAFDIVIVPLLLAFGLVIFVRFLRL